MSDYAEQLLFRLECQRPQCGKTFHELIVRLGNRNFIDCPACRKPVDLRPHKRAINSLIDYAAELDKPPNTIKAGD